MVELLGLPGCGKTTYFKTHFCEGYINPLDKIYNASRLKQNLNKLFPLGYFLLFSPILSYRVVRIFFKIKFSSVSLFLKMFVYLFSTLGVLEQSFRKYGRAIIRIDEGICQVLSSMLYVSSNSELIIESLLSLLDSYIGDRIIHFNIDDATIISRLKNRSNAGGSELQHDILNNEDALKKARFAEMFLVSKLNPSLIENYCVK